MKCCKDCTKRKVGCHSTCQTYVVQSVIHQYKRDKRQQEKDLQFNENQQSRLIENSIKRHDNFKMKSYQG